MPIESNSDLVKNFLPRSQRKSLQNVTIEAPFYRVLPTHQIYVSRSLYKLTESVNNIMLYVPTFAIVSAKCALCRISCV